MIHLKLIKELAKQKENIPAIVNDRKTLTWLELEIETERKIIFLLNHYGKNIPQQMCYIAKNCTDLIPWLAACTTLGISTTGLDYTLPLDSLKKLSAKIGVDFLLVSSSLFPKDIDITTLSPAHAMTLDIDSITQCFLGAERDSIEIDILDYIIHLNLPKKPFKSIGLTSGTTSLPKVVIRTQSFDQRRFSYFSRNYKFSNLDRFLVAMPLYHAAGNGWARLFMSLGATIFLANPDTPSEIALTMKKDSITTSVMTPVLLTALVEIFEVSPEKI